MASLVTRLKSVLIDLTCRREALCVALRTWPPLPVASVVRRAVSDTGTGRVSDAVPYRLTDFM